MAIACVVIFTCRLQAGSKEIQLTPTTVAKQSRSFTITVNRFKGDKEGKYLRFDVKVKAKPGKAPLSPYLSTVLDVFDGEEVVSSALLKGTERDGEILYSYLVAAKYAEKSKFTFGELLATPSSQSLPPANHYWFYLKDFLGPK